MKYWLLTTEYPPFYGGGISTYCFYTAKMLLSEGHAVTVFVNEASVKDVLVQQLEEVRVVRFNPDKSGANDFLGHTTNISYQFAQVLKSFVEKEGKPDVIEAQEYLGIAYYLLQYRYLLYEWCKNIPVLITMHSPAFVYLVYNHVSVYKYPNYWIGEMERFCLQAADVVISPSKYLVQEVKAHFKFTNKNTFVVPNPFEFKSKTNDFQKLQDNDQIVFFGKLSVQKGTFKLLHYFQQLWQQGFAQPLYLIGGQDIVYHPEGKMMGDIIKKKYKHFVNEGLLRLEKRLAPTEIESRLAKAKVVIIPSTVDNLPYVVLEMMAMGLIVLVSKQGGQAEIVEDGISGFIFDHDQPESFFVQLDRIMKLSAEEKDSIARNAKAAIVKKYALQNIYKEKIALLENFIPTKNASANFPFVQQTNISDGALNQANSTLLSIIIPYYNMGKYIDETMESLLQIDYTQTEILIINDGSNEDASIEKLQAYTNRSGVKIINTPNQGLASARNTGAKMAAGTYLAFLDADDKVHPTYYSKAIKVLQHYPNVHFVGCWTQYFEGSVKVWPAFTPEAPLILYHNLINSSSLVYKKQSFLVAGKNDTGMDFQGLEDYESVIALTTNGYCGVVLPEIMFYYRVRKDSMIRGISKTKKLLLYEHITKKYKKEYGTFATEILSLTNANGSGVGLDNPSLDLALTDAIPFGNWFSKRLIRLIKRNSYIKNTLYRIYRLIN